jgi:hypothetical protein
MSDKQTVVVATYEHGHGDDVRIFHHEDGAERWRREIAAEWFELEIGEPPPADPKEAADIYFDKLGSREFFTTTRAVIEN